MKPFPSSFVFISYLSGEEPMVSVLPSGGQTWKIHSWPFSCFDCQPNHVATVWGLLCVGLNLKCGWSEAKAFYWCWEKSSVPCEVQPSNNIKALSSSDQSAATSAFMLISSAVVGQAVTTNISSHLHLRFCFVWQDGFTAHCIRMQLSAVQLPRRGSFPPSVFTDLCKHKVTLLWIFSP